MPGLTNGDAAPNGGPVQVLLSKAPKTTNTGRSIKLAAGTVSLPPQKLPRSTEGPPLISLDFADTELIRYLVYPDDNSEPEEAQSQQLWLGYHDSNHWSAINRALLTEALADIVFAAQIDAEFSYTTEIDLPISILWNVKHINVLPTVMETWCAENGLIVLPDQVAEYEDSREVPDDLILWLTRLPDANAASPQARLAVRRACVLFLAESVRAIIAAGEAP